MATASWVLPTTYTNGDPIPPGTPIVTHIYLDGVEVAVSKPGETSVQFTAGLVPGESYNATAKCEVEGVEDELSAPSDPPFVFVVPFLIANPPTGLSITS